MLGSFIIYTQCIIQYLIVMLALCAFRMIEEHYIDDILFVLNCTRNLHLNNGDLSEIENTTVNQNSLALMMTPSYQTTISKIVSTEKDTEQDKSTSWIKSLSKPDLQRLVPPWCPSPDRRVCCTLERLNTISRVHTSP